ncbi:unnamed protein product [Prorocentrum cordatum]|uniref:Fe2OG dioxygenase domain-containing protein n=1 Tax=Prorocentrum cordatum TaxID=2364126 RepID=A0ABN9TW73_9DINO|nr:unnamed protein product [Polarella glacialis]
MKDSKQKKLSKKEKKLAKKLKKKEKKVEKKLRKLDASKKAKKRKRSSSSSSSPSSSSSGPPAAAPAPARGADAGAEARAPAVVEPSRESVGLRLLGDVYAVGKPSSELRWEYPLRDEVRRCFAGVLRPRLPQGTLRRLEELAREGAAWHQPKRPRTGELLPRKTDWMTAEGCRCAYRYGGVEVGPTEFPGWMAEVMETVMPLCGIRGQGRWPNCCNLNLYEDGGMSVGWHADDEELFQGKVGDCPIISFSLGHTRTFELQVLGAQGDGEQPLRIPLHSGDVLTMEGLVQKHYQHRVPREKAQGARINFTWRWIRQHQARCPLGRK